MHESHMADGLAACSIASCAVAHWLVTETPIFQAIALLVSNITGSAGFIYYMVKISSIVKGEDDEQ